jgi:hypothetical protein
LSIFFSLAFGSPIFCCTHGFAAVEWEAERDGFVRAKWYRYLCNFFIALHSKLFLDVLLLALSGSCISVRNWRGDVRVIGSHQPRIGWFWIDFFGNFVVL